MHELAAMTVPDGALAISWFGQSSFALKSPAGTIVQIDPYFPRERPAERFIHAVPPLDEADLPTNMVLLTHNHSDHTCLESLLRIQGAFAAVEFVGPVESVETLLAQGIPAAQTVTVAAGDRVERDDVTIHAVWAKPPDGAPADGIAPPDVTHLGFVVESGPVRVYISGDPINTFAAHPELLAPIQALRPQVGLLTTHPTEGEFPYFAGTVQMARSLGLEVAVPAHYACFVERTYDPQEWATLLTGGDADAGGPRPEIIPLGGTFVYRPS